MENPWKYILDYYTKEKGSALTGYEILKLSNFFKPFKIYLSKVEAAMDNKLLSKEIEKGLPPFNFFKIPEYKQEISLRNLHYQSLVDFKDGKCSEEVCDYIQKYL